MWSKANWSLLGPNVGPEKRWILMRKVSSGAGGPPADGWPARREEEREREGGREDRESYSCWRWEPDGGEGGGEKSTQATAVSESSHWPATFSLLSAGHRVNTSSISCPALLLLLLPHCRRSFAISFCLLLFLYYEQIPDSFPLWSEPAWTPQARTLSAREPLKNSRPEILIGFFSCWTSTPLHSSPHCPHHHPFLLLI